MALSVYTTKLRSVGHGAVCLFVQALYYEESFDKNWCFKSDYSNHLQVILPCPSWKWLNFLPIILVSFSISNHV